MAVIKTESGIFRNASSKPPQIDDRTLGEEEQIQKRPLVSSGGEVDQRQKADHEEGGEIVKDGEAGQEAHLAGAEDAL